MLLFHPIRRLPAECCGMLRTAATTIRTTHGTRTCCEQRDDSTHFKHYLRSPYSVIYHHYKNAATLAEAKSFVNNFPKLRDVDEAQLDHTLKLIKEDGHCWKEVELFKEVLLLMPVEYNHRVKLLQDLSLSHPSLYHVKWMISVMCCSVKILNKSIFDSDPLEHLLLAGHRDLKLPESTLQAAWDQYSRDDQVTLKQVYFYLLKHYLSFRFSQDTDSVGSFLKNTYLPSVWKPLSHFPRMCDIIISCLGLSFSEVQDQPILLFLDSDNTKEILKSFPSIGGIPTRTLVKAHPRLLQVPASQLHSWLRVLHRYQVLEFSYTHHTTNMFKTSSYSVVEKRLQSLQGLQEWEVIEKSDRLFEILRSQKHTKRLLNAAASGEIMCSISSAIRANESTEVKQRHSITPEVVSYVAYTLDLPINQTQELLIQDIYTHFGISNIMIVLRLLLDYGFTREQVVAGVIVLNFEAEVVEQTLRDLHTRPEAEPFAEWMENPFVLHLLAYCIKKDFPHLDLPMKKSEAGD